MRYPYAHWVPGPLRANDFSRSEEDVQLSKTYQRFFALKSPLSVVRAAEPTGFDAALFEELTRLDTWGMGLAGEQGGGAGMVELTAVAEQHGSALAPVPFAETVAAARAIERMGQAGEVLAEAVVKGDVIPTIAMRPQTVADRQLVPAGAVASVIVVLTSAGTEVRRIQAAEPADNFGHTPLAWIDLAELPVIARTSGTDVYDDALREWRLLTAACLVGLAQAALDLAVEYARERSQFGQPIGTYQAISHPLVDSHIGIAGGRRLVGKAAWFMDFDRSGVGGLPEMAFAHNASTAATTTAHAVHVFGGAGLVDEPPIEAYFRRAKGWALVAGDPFDTLRSVSGQIVDALVGR